MHLDTPFPPARNPATTWAEQHTLGWASSWGLLTTSEAYETFAIARFAELMGRAYPLAEPDLLATIADWNSWTFLVDTQLDHAALGYDPTALDSFALEAASILGDQPCPVNPHWPPLLHALHDVIQRLRRYATSAWLRRFRHNVGATLAMCVREAANRQEGFLVSEAIYREMRPHTSGVYCFLDLIELTNHAMLADNTRAHPSVVQLTDLATEAIYLANDLASADKERPQGDGNNLVLILERDYGLSPDESARMVVARHNAVVKHFVQATERLQAAALDDSDPLSRYVTGLGTWMRANLDWSCLTGRYQPTVLQANAVNADSPSPLYRLFYGGV